MSHHVFWIGDALGCLRRIPDTSVNCVVTSPPYWGLRDYGVPGQIGMERTPEEYVQRLVEVFREVRRVLRNDGTLWLNLGDSYADGGRGGGGAFMRERRDGAWHHRAALNGWRSAPPGLKHKDLAGIPWRVAFALQADGWYLRSDIIWHKPNAMPESVTDRPTRSHEYVFLLTRAEKYQYNAAAISEPVSRGYMGSSFTNGKTAIHQSNRASEKQRVEKVSRNIRSVWAIPTEPFAGAHFAVMPTALAEKCILAGCPPGGTVLDPFGGAGTVTVAAMKHNRDSVYVDINPDYAGIALDRCGFDKPRLMIDCHDFEVIRADEAAAAVER